METKKEYILFIYIYIYIYEQYNKRKCLLGVCSGEGEYITHDTCSNGNNLDVYPGITCDYEGYETTRYAGANVVILLLENVNRMMGL